MVSQFLPDAIILDIGLPLISGYEVARKMRALPESRDAAIIALSGYGQEGDKCKAYEAGFDAYLVKPASPAELFAALTAGMATRQPK